MIIKGENPDNIKPESSFSHDGFPNMTFDYILSNPPFGKDWNQDKAFIEEEYERGFSGRFGADYIYGNSYRLISNIIQWEIKNSKI